MAITTHIHTEGMDSAANTYNESDGLAAHTYIQTQWTLLHTYTYTHTHIHTHTYIHTFIHTHIYTYWFPVERVRIWLMAVLDRVEQVIAYLMAAPEVNKSPPKIRLELTPVSHHTLLGIIMMGRETEARLLQVRKIQALHIWLLTRTPIHIQAVITAPSILMTKPHLETR